jgi:hypothetical protein
MLTFASSNFGEVIVASATTVLYLPFAAGTELITSALMPSFCSL